MSGTHPITRIRIRAALATAGVALALVPTTHARGADVVPFACDVGAQIQGVVSDFQDPLASAQVQAYTTACNGGRKPPVKVTTGDGVAALTAGTAQFAGTDIPYSDAQWTFMQARSGSHVETIPIAVGAVGVAVNEPACIASTTKISGATIAAIYAGTITDWKQVFPTACPAQAITAFHRADSSGTTAAFKTYLTKKDAADYTQGCDGATCFKDATPSWPAPGTTCAGLSGNANADMVACLSSTVGAIAYIDEADAASAGIATVQVDNAQGVLGFSNPMPGACTAAAQASATPTTTAADWSRVDITDGPSGYGICTYTYQLAFDTPVLAGNATASQAQTIRNFIAYEVSDAGQAVVAANGFDALPTQQQAAAQLGAALLVR